MPLQLDGADIAVRLLCAVLAGGMFGFNRTGHGRVAGLRTMMLVSLAACLSMVQVNLLLGLSGKAPNSFINLDPMRLPLGILSGMGFIGAGAIVRREQLVIGVTTAATMWFVTVIGLCFGAGQLMLGLAGSGLGITILWMMKRMEDRIKQDRQGKLLIVSDAEGPKETVVRSILQGGGIKVLSCAIAAQPRAGTREFQFELQWRAEADSTATPAVVESLVEFPGVVRLSWTPAAR